MHPLRERARSSVGEMRERDEREMREREREIVRTSQPSHGMPLCRERERER